MGWMRERVSVAVACAIAAPLVALGCGSDSGSGSGTAAEGGEMSYAMSSYPDYLDPQLSYTVEGWLPLWVSYTPLLTYEHASGEAGTEVIPGLAQDLPEVTNGGKTYKLTLRKGMKYSDGQPIKASDFKYAVERMFDVNSGGSFFYTDIVGASDYQKGNADEITGITTNDKTGDITIELTKPRGTFNNELALMFVAPVPQSTPKDKDQSNSPPPSSGPYEITNVDPGRTFTLKKNPEFKTIVDAGADIPEGHLNTINGEEIKNTSSQVTDIEQNNLDFMVDPPTPDRLQEVQQKYSDRFRLEDSINIYYFWMNTQEPPFDDVKVRQAVNYAIDPDAMVRLFGGRLTPEQQILPKGMPGYQKLNLYPGPDVAKAKQLIKQAHPSDLDVTVWTDDEPDRKKIGAYYQDVLNKIGFNADLKIVAGKIYFQTIGNLKTPNLDTGFSDWFQDYPNPNDFFDPLLNGASILPTNNNNYSQADFPELNKEIDRLAGEQLDDQTKQDYADLDRSYMEEAVWAPYGSEKLATFTSDQIDFNNVIFHPLFNQDFTSFATTGG